MSRFIYKYNPILEIVLKVNSIAVNSGKFKIIPDFDSEKILTGNKLKFKITPSGFLLFRRIDTIWIENFANSVKIATPLRDFIPLYSPIPLSLRFCFIAQTTFSIGTIWEGMGYHLINSRYMKYSYTIQQNGTFLLTPSHPSWADYLEEDFLIKPTASLDLTFNNFPPIPTPPGTIIIPIDITKPLTP